MNRINEKDPADQGVVENVKEYIQLRLDLLKINIVEKSSLFLTLFISIIIGIILLFAASAFFFGALAYWLGSIFGSMIPGLLIIGGFFLLLFFIFYLFKDKIIFGTLIKKLSEILFSDDQNDNDNE